MAFGARALSGRRWAQASTTGTAVARLACESLAVYRDAWCVVRRIQRPVRCHNVALGLALAASGAGFSGARVRPRGIHRTEGGGGDEWTAVRMDLLDGYLRRMLVVVRWQNCFADQQRYWRRPLVWRFESGREDVICGVKNARICESLNLFLPLNHKFFLSRVSHACSCVATLD